MSPSGTEKRVPKRGDVVEVRPAGVGEWLDPAPVASVGQRGFDAEINGRPVHLEPEEEGVRWRWPTTPSSVVTGEQTEPPCHCGHYELDHDQNTGCAGCANDTPEATDVCARYRPRLTKEKLDELAKEGAELRREVERRTAPMPGKPAPSVVTGEPAPKPLTLDELCARLDADGVRLKVSKEGLDRLIARLEQERAAIQGQVPPGEPDDPRTHLLAVELRPLLDWDRDEDELAFELARVAIKELCGPGRHHKEGGDLGEHEPTWEAAINWAIAVAEQVAECHTPRASHVALALREGLAARKQYLDAARPLVGEGEEGERG